MADLGYAFDPNSVEPLADITALPDGWYQVVIEESGFKATRAGTGEYLELALRVLDGAYKNRKVWARLNLRHDQEKTRNMAVRELATICQAAHKTHAIRDSSELHNIPIEAHVVYVPPTAEYKAKNDVKGWRAVGSGGPQHQAPPAPRPVAPVPAAPAGGPWQARPAAAPATPPPAAAPQAPAGAPPWAVNQ